MEWNKQDPLTDEELDAWLAEWKIEEPSGSLRWIAPSRRRMWLAAAVGAACAASFVAALLPRRPSAAPQPRPFTPIPYTLPLAEGETASVVRMNVPVAALLAAGLRLPAADPTAVVPADVIVGSDGRPRAVRLAGTAARESN